MHYRGLLITMLLLLEPSLDARDLDDLSAKQLQTLFDYWKAPIYSAKESS